jgi:hypothetical protein
LKDKPKQSPERKPGMTANEMKVAEKNYRDASLWMFNLSVAIRDSSSEQAEIIDGGLNEVTEKIQGIQCKLR